MQQRLRNAKLDDGLWNDGQSSYGGKLVHVFAPLAGVTDQTLAEIRDLYEMAGMVGQVWDNPRGVVEDLYGFYEQLSVDAVRRMVSEGIRSEIETLSTPGVQRQYKLGGYVVQAVVAIAAITKEGGELILDFAERFGQKADNIRDFVGNFTQELGERFQLLSPEQKGAFFEDFGGDGDAIEAFNGNPGMVDSWERVNQTRPELSNDVHFLETFTDVLGNISLSDHIFKGKIEITGGAPGAYSFKVSGVHHNEALDGATARIKSGTQSPPNENGYYTGRIEMYHPGNVNNNGWKTKDRPSTFFPDSWSRQKVQEEIAIAFNNKTLLEGNKYEGVMSDGTILHIFMDGDTITSAFPVID